MSPEVQEPEVQDPEVDLCAFAVSKIANIIVAASALGIVSHALQL